jgi:FtsZ-binding cell division protein ZapB
MFSSIRIAILLFLISLIGAGYWYITKLQSDLETARANVVRLEAAVATSEESIKTLQQDFVKMAELNGKLQKDLQKAEAYSDALRSKFSRLDLVQDALKDPKNLEGRMNNATAKLWREIMSETGSDTTRPLPNWVLDSRVSNSGTGESSSDQGGEGSNSDGSTTETNPAQ